MDSFSLIKDKDKLFVICNVCISNVSKQKGMDALVQIKNYYEQQFDDTVKFLVMPVLEPSLQKMEVINPKLISEETIKELKENYEKFLKKISEINK